MKRIQVMKINIQIKAKEEMCLSLFRNAVLVLLRRKIIWKQLTPMKKLRGYEVEMHDIIRWVGSQITTA